MHYCYYYYHTIFGLSLNSLLQVRLKEPLGADGADVFLKAACLSLQPNLFCSTFFFTYLSSLFLFLGRVVD